MKSKRVAQAMFATLLATTLATNAFAGLFGSGDKSKPTPEELATDAAIKKTPIDPQELLAEHFQAVLKPMDSESFIWVEAVKGYDINPDTGKLQPSPALIFRNCDIETAVHGGNAGGEQGSGGKVTQDSVDLKLESASDILIQNHISINPRKCRPVLASGDVIPIKNVLEETEGFEKVLVQVGRIAADSAVITIGGVTSSAFKWAAPAAWAGGILAAKSWTNFMGDKPAADFQATLRIDETARRAMDIQRRHVAANDGFYIVERIHAKVTYPQVLAGIRDKLMDIEQKYCKHSTSAHKNPLCDQWDETDMNHVRQYVAVPQDDGTRDDMRLLDKFKLNPTGPGDKAPTVPKAEISTTPSPDENAIMDPRNMGIPYDTLWSDDHFSDRAINLTL